MHATQRARTTELLRDKKITHALFADPASITWLTGFAAPIQTGPGPFTAGPALVWYEDGAYTLLVGASHAGVAQELDCEVMTYEDYALEPDFGGAQRLLQALQAITGKPTLVTSSLGIEQRHIPLSLLQSLLHTVWVDRWQVIDGWLHALRARKGPEEVALLRENFDLLLAGHGEATVAVRPGRREIDVWCDIHTAIQVRAGRRVPLGNDCVVSHREMNIGGWPTTMEIHGGDSLIVDLGARVNGYWSDSCATYYASEPSPRQREIHGTVLAALELAISLLQPGAIAGEIDRQVRAFIEDAGFPVYPHHTGHGVGVTAHEAPRLVPGNGQTLEAGMVVMVEPGIYFPGEAAVRLEDAVLITPEGPEVLTQHSKAIASKGEK